MSTGLKLISCWRYPPNAKLSLETLEALWQAGYARKLSAFITTVLVVYNFLRT